MGSISKKGIVKGKVQGVWFRAFVQKQANQTGISGYAKNLADGSVEVLLCGEKTAIEKVEMALHQGPPLAKVKEVSLCEIPNETITGFSTY